jgi:hypothetical protein
MHQKKPYGYTIEFFFNQNEFFTNAVLTKTYELVLRIIIYSNKSCNSKSEIKKTVLWSKYSKIGKNCSLR